MPKKKQIIGRYLGLFQDGMKDKSKRIAEIVGELLSLWQKLNFPNVSKQQICAKVSQLVNGYITYRKKKPKNLKKILKMCLILRKLTNFGYAKKISLQSASGIAG